jgi:hypothetical protein
MREYYVYRHFKLNTNEVFYIGMGKEKNLKRAHSKRYRNNHWHNTVEKYGYYVDVVATNLSEEEAKELEVFLIKLYGRRDLNTGTLVNMTDGGEGVFNPSPESLINRSGSKSHMARRIMNMDTKEIFGSLSECCVINNISYSSTKKRLNGVIKNKTPYVYIDELNNPLGKYNEDMTIKKCICSSVKSKKCINIKNEKIYKCIREASNDINVNRSTLKADIIRKIYKYNIMYLEDYTYPNGKHQHVHIINNKYTTL